MGRAFTYVIFFTILLFTLEFLGFGWLVGNTLLNLLGFSPDIINSGIDFSQSSNNFIIAVIAILATIGTTGIAIGFLTKTSTENYVLLPFITGTAILFADVIAGLIRDVSVYPAPFAATIVVVFLTMGIGYFWTMIEFFRGNV